MQTLRDETAFDWIRSGRNELKDSKGAGGAGNFVSHLMPPVFEAYAKILHRIEAHYENIDNPLSPQEISILKIPPCEQLRALVESRRDGAEGTRIKWLEVAEALDVPFSHEINHTWYGTKLQEGCWSRFLYGPSEGWLSEEECGALISILNPFMTSPECFFRFSEWPFFNTGKARLFYGPIDGLSDLRKTSGFKISPEYWWPPNQTWCVCSDYDLKFTVVGGSRKLIAGLLLSQVVECLEVMESTRIDSLVPMP